jgi:hypothetical protein
MRREVDPAEEALRRRSRKSIVRTHEAVVLDAHPVDVAIPETQDNEESEEPANQPEPLVGLDKPAVEPVADQLHRNVSQRRRRPSSLVLPEQRKSLSPSDKSFSTSSSLDSTADKPQDSEPVLLKVSDDGDEGDVVTLTTVQHARGQSVEFSDMSQDWLQYDAAFAENSEDSAPARERQESAKSEATTTNDEEDDDNVVSEADTNVKPGRQRRQTFHQTIERMANMTIEERQGNSVWEAGLAARRRRSVIA